MEARDRIMAAFREDLKAIISGEDQTPIVKAVSQCDRCGMRFKSSAGAACGPEITTCAEPGCGRRFAHGAVGHHDGKNVSYINVYAL